MKATCKLCGVVIETDPDPIMDDQRDQRERNTFFNRVAFHIDPRNKVCLVNNQKFSALATNALKNVCANRFGHAMQDNGWFQRWRLLACLDNLDEKCTAKAEEWRDYLHTITAKPSSAPESSEPEGAGSANPSVQ
jgi:hypothetical protein